MIYDTLRKRFAKSHSALLCRHVVDKIYFFKLGVFLFKLKLQLDNSYFHTYSFLAKKTPKNPKTPCISDCLSFFHFYILCKSLCSYCYRWTSGSLSKRAHHFFRTDYLFQDILELLFLLSSGELTVRLRGTPPCYDVVSFELLK